MATAAVGGREETPSHKSWQTFLFFSPLPFFFPIFREKSWKAPPNQGRREEGRGQKRGPNQPPSASASVPPLRPLATTMKLPEKKGGGRNFKNIFQGRGKKGERRRSEGNKESPSFVLLHEKEKGGTGRNLVFGMLGSHTHTAALFSPKKKERGETFLKASILSERRRKTFFHFGKAGWLRAQQLGCVLWVLLLLSFQLFPRCPNEEKQERDPFTDLRRLLQSSDLTLTGMLSDLD